MYLEVSEARERYVPLKVAIINGICVRGDAISESVYGTAVALRDTSNACCKIFTYAYDYPDFPHSIVSSSLDILSDPYFQTADVVIYHFGVYYELFNTIFLAPKGAKKIVYYHNITPKELLPKSSHRIIEKSLSQRANIDAADEIWAASAYNKQDLVDFGIDPDKILVNSLYVRFSGKVEKPKRLADEAIELLYVGRFVASKGVMDVLNAVDTIRLKSAPVRLRLVGNVDFSDPNYIASLRERITALGLDQIVIFEGKVDDEILKRCYSEADAFIIASYHEGFCVPLIEAMRFGCVPIAYDAGNMASLIADNGLVVPTGDVAALSSAIATVVADVSAARRWGDSAKISWRRPELSWRAYRIQVADYVRQFEFDAYAQRLSACMPKTTA